MKRQIRHSAVLLCVLCLSMISSASSFADSGCMDEVDRAVQEICTRTVGQETAHNFHMQNGVTVTERRKGGDARDLKCSFSVHDKNAAAAIADRFEKDIASQLGVTTDEDICEAYTNLTWCVYDAHGSPLYQYQFLYVPSGGCYTISFDRTYFADERAETLFHIVPFADTDIHEADRTVDQFLHTDLRQAAKHSYTQGGATVSEEAVQDCWALQCDFITDDRNTAEAIFNHLKNGLALQLGNPTAKLSHLLWDFPDAMTDDSERMYHYEVCMDREPNGRCDVSLKKSYDVYAIRGHENPITIDAK